MGKRKLRFDSRKNFERKKVRQQFSPLTISHQSTPTSFIVSLPLSAFTSAVVDSLSTLLARIKPLTSWSITCYHTNSILSAFSLHRVCIENLPPFTVTIASDFTYSFFIGNSEICLRKFRANEALLLDTPCKVNNLLLSLETKRLCKGNPDGKFSEITEHRNGKFLSQSGNIVACYDARSLPLPTIRHSDCPFLIEIDSTERCRSCDQYRSTLFALVSLHVRATAKGRCLDTSSSHINDRYLTSAELKDRVADIRKTKKHLQLQIAALKAKMKSSFENEAVILDEETSSDLQKVMIDEEVKVLNSLPPDSFKRIFWQQQKENLQAKATGQRWHPLFIRWCLYIRHQSSKAYEALRDSGCIQLPSQRTLRDYSHCVRAAAGYSTEEDHQLMRAANMKSCPDWHKLIVLLIDEIHIKESVVYNKHTGRMVGFVDLGEVNSHLIAYEKRIENSTQHQVVAKSMVAVMVKGLFTPLRFPYTQFPCAALTGELLFQPFWEGVYRLERLGFKVLGVTFDGASTNRRLLAIHDTSDKELYKIINIHAEERRHIYFFSDPPHLIKTTRNCWAAKSRNLWVNGKNILWQHLIDLYNRDQGKASGLSLVPKLKYEHVYLTSFSKMRVDLAAQVLSDTVGKALLLTGGEEVEQTAKFVHIFNTFFDILNVNNFTNGTRNRNPFLHPYRQKNDFRIDWLRNEFLPYLDNWEKSVSERQGFSDADKKRMMLSTETLLGLKITAKSFIDFIEFLFSLPEVKDNHLAFLSGNLCQDPLENYFGCQRQRGGTSDNPTVDEYYKNTESLRVIDSFCRGPVRGNCRSRNSADIEPIPDLTPLPKRRRVTS